MAGIDHPTRRTLLASGLGLSESTALSVLSIDEIVRRSGVAKGTFYVHFKDRADYLTALHRQFHDDLRAVIAQSTVGLEPGVERLRRPTIAYLDGCLRAQGVKAMLAQARGLPEITAEVTAQNDRFARDAEPDFAAMGSAQPLEAARLYIAMVAETALLELDAGRRLPRLRNALFAYLDALDLDALDHARGTD